MAKSGHTWQSCQTQQEAVKSSQKQPSYAEELWAEKLKDLNKSMTSWTRPPTGQMPKMDKFWGVIKAACLGSLMSPYGEWQIPKPLPCLKRGGRQAGVGGSATPDMPRGPSPDRGLLPGGALRPDGVQQQPDVQHVPRVHVEPHPVGGGERPPAVDPLRRHRAAHRRGGVSHASPPPGTWLATLKPTFALVMSKSTWTVRLTPLCFFCFLALWPNLAPDPGGGVSFAGQE